MSVIEISLPDDRWFSGEWEIRPKDKQMCTVLMKDDLFPVICQWSNKIDCEDGISRGYFTNAAGQEASTSVSCGRNARFSDVF